jgi:phosphatidylinositol glycan class V
MHLLFARDVSPFRYWTILQLPNWLLALPALSLASFFVCLNYKKDLPSILTKTLTPWKVIDKTCNLRILPHIHFTLVTLLILLVNSHVQIVLRFASPGSLPAVWWSASYLVLQFYDAKRPSPWAASLILPYLVLWNMMSVVLYSGFYPPA